MKVLFLDDDHNRIRKAREYFSEDALFVAETAPQAISILEKESKFDVVSLDHDLGGKVYCPSDEFSGYEVANYIAGMPVERRPYRVVVHTYNPAGADNMMRALKDKVPELLRIPFSA